jgi:hypothetical protein
MVGVSRRESWTMASRTRRLIDLETHRTVFTWVQPRLVETGLLKGKTIAIDATTLEANAAMRSILRRDTAETYQEFLTRFVQASGIGTPTRENLARLDKKRKKKTSNKDWTNPVEPDAKVTKIRTAGRIWPTKPSVPSTSRRARSSPSPCRRGRRRHDDDRRHRDGRGRAGRSCSTNTVAAPSQRCSMVAHSGLGPGRPVATSEDDDLGVVGLEQPARDRRRL